MLSVVKSAPAEINFAELKQRAAHPAFDPLREWIDAFSGANWPTLAELSAGLPSGLQFVAASPSSANYELDIHARGEIPTRAQNWHDFFNALIWLGYPQSKRELNRQHVMQLAIGGEAERKRRSSKRDTLTLFDEGGAVIAYNTPEVAALIGAFQWKQLFYQRREALAGSYRVFVFGHASLERLLDPPLGLTNKCLLMPVDAGFLQMDTATQRASVDAWTCAQLTDQALLASTKNLAPFPLLGVPGYHPGTSQACFYDDESYFRPNYRKLKASAAGD